MARASDLLKGLTSLSSLPGVYLRLNQVVSDPRASSADVGRVIAEDPGLTARLLKLVNSAMYNFPSRIETVSHAISIVGTAQLQDLALATSVIRIFASMPEGLVTMDSFWRHSVACGVTARAIATRRRESNVERYFVAGLLHDIGRPVMYMQAPELSRTALTRSRQEKVPLVRVEQEVFGFDHTHVGQALLDQWKLPQALREAVAQHHHPERAQRFPAEAATVHVADILANAMAMGSSGETGIPPFVPSAWQVIGLAPATLGDLMEECERHYDAAVHVVAGERG